MTRHTDIEFWLFVPEKSLPDAELINQKMQALDPCLHLKTQGNLEEATDNVIEGLYIDEEGEEQLNVYWSMEPQNALKGFKKDKQALSTIGNNKKMLRFLIEDECALGHVFAMIYSILEEMGGLLVIPEEDGNIILPHQQALDFLKEEIEDVYEDDLD